MSAAVPGSAGLTRESHQLIPAPWSVEEGSGELELDHSATLTADPELNSTRRWLARTLGAATGWDLLPPAVGDANISMRLDPGLDAEAYKLTVDGSVTIHAGGPAGAFYGAQTLLLLMGPAALRQAPAGIGPAVLRVRTTTIQDRPRFGYRGAMLDVARHFMPKDNLLRFIEVLAMHKLNVLHLHLTDDQGWRVEIKRYPRLTEVGAWRRESSLGSWRAGVFDSLPHGGVLQPG